MQSEKLNLNKNTGRNLRELLGTACIVLFVPLIVITLIFLYIYRRSVGIVLRIQLKNKFAGLLKGTDYVWAVEDTVSLSVINILMILEKAAENSNAGFLKDFSNLVNDRIVSKAADTTLEKLFYLRRQKFGYYFWERSEKINLEDRIRWLNNCAGANCDGSCEDVFSESFRKTLENVYNRSLPNDHMAGWEILIGRRCLKSRSVEEGCLSSEECFNTNTRKIPILFRIHHSMGDGVALLGLLLKTIAEEEVTKEMRVKVKGITSADLRNSDWSFQNETNIVQFYEKKILAASMHFTYVTFSRVVQDLRDCFRASLKFSINATIELLKPQAKKFDRTWLNFKDIVLKRMYDKLKEVTQLMIILLSFPKFFVQQLATQDIDKNALHGPPQTGEKIVSYWLENNVTNDKSQNLLTKIRKIRKNTAAKFEDIVLAAFSVSVHKYHLRIGKSVPDALTTILPIRMSNENLTLDNNFSIGFLRVCISNASGQTISEPHRDSQFFKRLQDISRANNELRKSSDVLLNFWFMKYFSALLPVKILKALLSSHSTMAFSNIYGPEKIRILNNSVSNIAFWIPNKSTTALGFSLLSYGSNLHLSLIADKSIVKDGKAFMELLENTVHEIDIAYNNIILTRL
ncbi:uncharacterized protein LOC105202586 isoform X1 [Solenopsis invicta]|uniref:uncharacterized protein LOC105202586 isoform X1 n=1 Tax=Solenopsis invicta TaxID=13686 RepID=UPI0005959A5A|nr:uncharacterized protein LOC105202586 isoform X1 [Solenopsis invicta]